MHWTIFYALYVHIIYIALKLNLRHEGSESFVSDSTAGGEVHACMTKLSFLCKEVFEITQWSLNDGVQGRLYMPAKGSYYYVLVNLYRCHNCVHPLSVLCIACNAQCLSLCMYVHAALCIFSRNDMKLRNTHNAC